MTRSDDASRAPTAGAGRWLAPLALGAGAAWALPAAAAAWAPLRAPLGIADRTGDGLGVGLTFDDGPHPQGTPAVLELLAQAGVRATFFLVGEQIQRTGALAHEIVAGGHDVALHCHRHRNLLRLTPRQVRADLERARALISQATGREPSLYRPPYGIFSFPALRWAREQGMLPLLWTHWGRDWERAASTESITRLLCADLEPGSVVLLHDADDYGAPGSWRRTVAALPSVLAELERLQLRPGPV
ncbi:MAG: polysaccharide deacetylase family protein [Actinobacteria bacterium]|nr:MAG: polysaccharide deacetylase family protein [Actinomycetota bacterium]